MKEYVEYERNYDYNSNCAGVTVLRAERGSLCVTEGWTKNRKLVVVS